MCAVFFDVQGGQKRTGWPHYRYYILCVLCRLIDELLRVSKERGCYKVILDCSEANQPFYEKCGLIRKEVQMVGADVTY
jgi:hypothetical protein